MRLTDEQICFLLGLALVITIIIIAFKIIRTVFRQVKRIFKAIKKGFRKLKNNLRKNNKKMQGYKSFNGNTWYPDGTVWNARKEEWEEADYKNNK